MMTTTTAPCKETTIQESADTFRMLPDAVRARLVPCKLSGSDWGVLMALLKYSHNGRRAAFPGNATLAREAHVNERTVQKRLLILEGKGVIRRTTATSEEAGATHRLIELPFLAADWRPTLQESGPTLQESGPSTTPKRAWGGTPIRTSNEERRDEETHSATDAANAAVAAVSSPPRQTRKPSRPQRTTKPQPYTRDQLEEIDGDLSEASVYVCDALYGQHESDRVHNPQPPDLLSDTMPQTRAAIERYAALVARLLRDDQGVATYRNLVARAVALDLRSGGYLKPDPTRALQNLVLQVLRKWGWGKVKNPGAYFTRGAIALLGKAAADLSEIQQPKPKRKPQPKGRGGQRKPATSYGQNGVTYPTSRKPTPEEIAAHEAKMAALPPVKRPPPGARPGIVQPARQTSANGHVLNEPNKPAPVKRWRVRHPERGGAFVLRLNGDGDGDAEIALVRTNEKLTISGSDSGWTWFKGGDANQHLSEIGESVTIDATGELALVADVLPDGRLELLIGVPGVGETRIVDRSELRPKPIYG